jgi:hypothetical protein
VLHLAHFCGWGCAKLSLQFIGRNCACSILQLGLCQTQSAVYLMHLRKGSKLLKILTKGALKGF